MPSCDNNRYSNIKVKVSWRLILISKTIEMKFSLFNLHTGECIHGRYFVARPSIHAIGGFLPIAQVSVIYTDMTTTFRELNSHFLKWFVASFDQFSYYLPSSGKLFLAVSWQQKKHSRLRKGSNLSPQWKQSWHNQKFQMPLMKTKLRI